MDSSYVPIAADELQQLYPERLGRQPNALSTAWSAGLAYTVAVIATDGNLARTRPQISITSKDRQMLEVLQHCLGLDRGMTRSANGRGQLYHRLQWRSRPFYDWLLSIGLTPAKSLTLGPLVVPDEYFADFCRRCIDGDGTVLAYTDRHHTVKESSYVYERLYVSLASASRAFIDWMRQQIHRLCGGARGAVHMKRAPGRHHVWIVRYSKKESVRLLHWMYYSPRCTTHRLSRALLASGRRPSRSCCHTVGVSCPRGSGGTRDTRGAQNAMPARA